MRHRYAAAVAGALLVTAVTLVDVGCDSSTPTTSNEALPATPGNIPQLAAAQGVRVSGYLDQYCEGSENNPWINIQRGTLLGQKVTPRAGSRHDCGCNFLVGVEVGLVTANPGYGGDTVTLFVIDFDGEVLAEVSGYIDEGFDGFYSSISRATGSGFPQESHYYYDSTTREGSSSDGSTVPATVIPTGRVTAPAVVGYLISAAICVLRAGISCFAPTATTHPRCIKYASWLNGPRNPLRTGELQTA